VLNKNVCELDAIGEYAVEINGNVCALGESGAPALVPNGGMCGLNGSDMSAGWLYAITIV
jgi:hypothetical protein